MGFAAARRQEIEIAVGPSDETVDAHAENTDALMSSPQLRLSEMNRRPAPIAAPIHRVSRYEGPLAASCRLRSWATGCCRDRSRVCPGRVWLRNSTSEPRNQSRVGSFTRFRPQCDPALLEVDTLTFHCVFCRNSAQRPSHRKDQRRSRELLPLTIAAVLLPGMARLSFGAVGFEEMPHRHSPWDDDFSGTRRPTQE